MTIHGIHADLAAEWTPIVRAAQERITVANDDDGATALGGALGRLLIAVPDKELVRRLQNRGGEW